MVAAIQLQQSALSWSSYRVIIRCHSVRVSQTAPHGDRRHQHITKTLRIYLTRVHHDKQMNASFDLATVDI